MTLDVESILSILLLILILLVFLIPFYALIRWPGAMNLGVALRMIGGSIMAAFFLTIALAAAFQVLAALIPGLNPYRPPAYESIDGGFFGVLVGFELALLLICVGQWRLIRSRIQTTKGEK